MKKNRYNKNAGKACEMPSMHDIIAYMKEQTDPINKASIARDFRIKGESMKQFKSILRELKNKGIIKGHNYRTGKVLKLKPAASMLCDVRITHQDDDNILWASAIDTSLHPQPIKIIQNITPPVEKGQDALVRLCDITDDMANAVIIKKINRQTTHLLCVYDKGCVYSVDRRVKLQFEVKSTDIEVKDNDIIVVQVPVYRTRNPKVKIIEKVGTMNNPFAPTLISMYLNKIPHIFSEEQQAEMAHLTVPNISKNRKDLRDIPFVTIDGDDAKDFDDAVYAIRDTSAENKNGFHIYVAIADVSWYVKNGMHIDKQAAFRGNSVYFPDRVVPMLPFELSNGVCSLNPNEDKAVMVCEMVLDKTGQKIKHQFYRALMQSKARLTYNQVQLAIDGAAVINGLENEINALHDVYLLLNQKRKKRGVIDLNLPERRIVLDEEGYIQSFMAKEQLTSMKLIEELMILANISAAETLEENHMPTMYRVHDKPSENKIHLLNNFLKTIGIKRHKELPQSVVPNDFNILLQSNKGGAKESALQEFVLRSQSQAVYSPKNGGHFGLSLEKYVHFTSPIRRYADIMVHRALVKCLNLGEGGITQYDIDNFPQIAEHISITERAASSAEQDAIDRYIATYLQNQVGRIFRARICSLHTFGMFLKLSDTGADAFLPMAQMHGDYYSFDEDKMAIIGPKGGCFALGDMIKVELLECSPITGGIVCALPYPTKKTKYPKHPKKMGRKTLLHPYVKK